MFKSEREIKSYSSARSRRVSRVYFAPPFLVFIMFGISILIQVPAGYVINKFSFAAGMLLNQLGALLIPTLFAIRFFGLTRQVVLPFKRVSSLHVLLAMIMMFALAIITDYLIYLTEVVLPIPTHLDQVYVRLMGVNGMGEYFFKLLFLCMLPSFCEEVFFRGFCQTGFMSSYGKKIGILVTAVLFAIAHLNFWYIHLYFLLGIFLSWIFATSGSLWIPILCHVINNLWTFTMFMIGHRLPVREGPLYINILIAAFALLNFVLGIYGWRLVNRKS